MSYECELLVIRGGTLILRIGAYEKQPV